MEQKQTYREEEEERVPFSCVAQQERRGFHASERERGAIRGVGGGTLHGLSGGEVREGERKEGSKEEGSGEQARRGVRLLYYTALWGRGGAILASETEEADFGGRTDGPESARPRRRTGGKSQQPDEERERGQFLRADCRARAQKRGL